MGLTALVLSGTWGGSSKQQNADSPSLRSAWGFSSLSLSKLSLNSCTALAHPASCMKHFGTMHLWGESSPFLSGVQCQLHFMSLLLGWKERNKAFCVCLLHDPLLFIDDIHTSIPVFGWLLIFNTFSYNMGKWLLIPSGWIKWTLVFCSPLPIPARKIPSVLKFYQWMCFCEGWSGQIWKKVLSAAKTNTALCIFPKISLL